MSISNLPPFYDMQWVTKEGNLTSNASMYSDEMSQTLIRAIDLLNKIVDSSITTSGNDPLGAVNYNSLNAPQKTTAQITSLGSDSSIPNGAIFFDTDVSKLKVKVGSANIETITSS